MRRHIGDLQLVDDRVALVDREQIDAMFAAVPGNHGAHGRFDRRSRADSSEFWLSRHGWLAAALGVGVIGVAAGALIGGRSLRALSETR